MPIVFIDGTPCSKASRLTKRDRTLGRTKARKTAEAAVAAETKVRTAEEKLSVATLKLKAAEEKGLSHPRMPGAENRL